MEENRGKTGEKLMGFFKTWAKINKKKYEFLIKNRGNGIREKERALNQWGEK